MNRLSTIYWCGALGALCLVLSVSGCATDGGVGGTGISTVQGNVVIEADQSATVRRDRPPVLQDSLAGIIVREPMTGIEDETDENGDFRLEGAFPLEPELEFQPPGAGRAAILEGLVVPLGSTLILENVRISDDRALPDTVRVSMPEGRVVSDALCREDGGDFDLEVEGVVFTVRMDETTSIENNRTCQNLGSGTTVLILAGKQQGLTILAERLKIAKSAQLPTD